ncbi:MAG TPA: YciI family protein [Devosiaceae bacterium]|jgi:hypothetical protein|nr:YciI family protein [Devosiaceae bacterium]
MTQYLVAIHRPRDYDPTTEDDAMRRAITALNDEMVAAGIRIFVGGLQPPSRAKSVRVRPRGKAAVTDGPYSEAKELIGGFWVLEVPDMEAAMAWGEKAATACRAGVEVRPFW